MSLEGLEGLLLKLEKKIDFVLDSMEYLKLQLEEEQTKNKKLISRNDMLEAKQIAWEKDLNLMLHKLDQVSIEEKECAEVT